LARPQPFELTRLVSFSSSNFFSEDKERNMAVAVLMEFANITQAQYDGVIEDMQLNGKPAPNASFHVAGPAENGGWRVVDVWDSAEAFDAFANDKIMPLAMKHGLKEPPKVTMWPVHNMLK
jgi:hypothetical protein